MSKPVIAAWKYLTSFPPFLLFWTLVFCPMEKVEFLGMSFINTDLLIWGSVLMFFIGMGWGIAATASARIAAVKAAQASKTAAVAP